jgi:hypothetical protein
MVWAFLMKSKLRDQCKWSNKGVEITLKLKANESSPTFAIPDTVTDQFYFVKPRVEIQQL